MHTKEKPLQSDPFDWPKCILYMYITAEANVKYFDRIEKGLHKYQRNW